MAYGRFQSIPSIIYDYTMGTVLITLYNVLLGTQPTLDGKVLLVCGNYVVYNCEE